MTVSAPFAQKVQEYVKSNYPDQDLKNLGAAVAAEVGQVFNVSAGDVEQACAAQYEQAVDAVEKHLKASRGKRGGARRRSSKPEQQAKRPSPRTPGARPCLSMRPPVSGPCLSIKPPPSKPCLSIRPPDGPCLSIRPPPDGPCLSIRPPPDGPCLSIRPPTGPCLSIRPPTGPCLSMRPPRDPDGPHKA